MKESWQGNWQQIFADNKLANFDALWELKAEWFEPPNIRQGGWSNVVKIKLDTPQGEVSIFMKRQHNYLTKSLLHPIKGQLTFEREFNNLLTCKDNKIPVAEHLYFGQRNINGNRQAILITKALSDFIPLDSEEVLRLGTTVTNRTHQNRLITKVAEALSLLHHHHLQHNCLYPKHIFIKPINDTWDVKFIDLEKMKKTVFKRNATHRDLDTFSRHAKGWSTKQRITFLRAYLKQEKLSNKAKSLWRSLMAKDSRKLP